MNKKLIALTALLIGLATESMQAGFNAGSFFGGAAAGTGITLLATRPWKKRREVVYVQEGSRTHAAEVDRLAQENQALRQELTATRNNKVYGRTHSKTQQAGKSYYRPAQAAY